MTGHPESLCVIKIGGGLSRIPYALEATCDAVGNLSRKWPIVVIPGGGPFADMVREFDAGTGLSAEVAHWLAILAMDQYAHVLASHIPDAVLVDEPGCIGQALAGGRAVVLAPFRWMRSADVLPHSWDVTSDSIAAFVAGALDARRLVLIKPDSRAADLLDPYFFKALPADLPHSVVGADRIADLAAELSR